MADLWNDSTDMLLNDVDGFIFDSYKVHIKELLSNPYRFVEDTNILDKIDKIKADVDDYIDTLLKTLVDERRDFENKAAAANALTNQLSQMISLAAKQKNIPVIKPTLFFIDQTKLDIIYIEKSDQNITALINKILPITTYISDTSVTYKGYSFGDWTFATDSSKNYEIRVNIPSNMVFQLEQSRDTVDGLLTGTKKAIAEMISTNNTNNNTNNTAKK